MPRGMGGEGAACFISSSISHHVQLCQVCASLLVEGEPGVQAALLPLASQTTVGSSVGRKPAFSVKGLLCRGFISAHVGNRMPLTQRAEAAVGSPSLSTDARAVSCLQQESSPCPPTSPSGVLLLISEQDATRRDGESSRDPFLWDGVGFGSTRVYSTPTSEVPRT